MPKLSYAALERLPVSRPVVRLGWIPERSRGRRVLDLGCLDETALFKRGTGSWLHEEIAKVAKSVVGMDNSTEVPPEGLLTSPTSRIYRGDAMSLRGEASCGAEIDLIVAGELIEHISDTESFFRQVKAEFPGRELIASTPNSTSFSNVALAALTRESCHSGHLQIYSYKTLNTLCIRAGFNSWTILPYYVDYSELTGRSRGIKRALVKALQRLVNGIEFLFPLLSGGLILHVLQI